MNVLFLSPGFPIEMNDFVRGLAEVGASVIGVGDQPEGAVPEKARRYLSAYFQVGSFTDENAVLAQVADIAHRVRIERVEVLWEPLMILAARIRELLGLPGLTVAESLPFRDKEEMKRKIDGAGVRTPHHYRSTTMAEVRAALERVGYPAIVKPIAGAGSLDTYRLDGPADLERIAPALHHIRTVSVEEFIEAEEFTFDTICAGGRILFYNICWYRPRPLVGKQLEWVSQQTVVLRQPDVDHLAAGREMGFRVIEAMGFRDGFTHMEWYLKDDGEAVFGEIGGRPPGGRTVDCMNFASEIDLFVGWAEAIVHGRFTQPLERKYNCANVFKRAIGGGRIQRYEGLGRLMAEFGEHVAAVELNPIGQPRRAWRQVLIGDGMVVVRHPDLQTCIDIADRFGTDLQIHAE